MNARNVVRAFAPGSVGNIGPGLDIMGLALTGPGDTVEARLGTVPGVTVADAGHPDLPVDPTLNTAALAAGAVAKLSGKAEASIELRILKGLPLSGGQGGSAASAVAGAVAANALLSAGLSHLGLLEAALTAEMVVAGTHLDNILPSLLGGIVLVRDEASRDFIRLRVPEQLRVVLAHPAQQLKTRESRAVLPVSLSRGDALYQAAQVAAMTAAFVSGELGLLRRAVDDRIAEPARAALLPGFKEAKAAALGAGALGCSISGSGPTSFAFADSDPQAARVAQAMADAYQKAGIACSTRVERISVEGARVLRGTEAGS
jgi:homoserine kinase